MWSTLCLWRAFSRSRRGRGGMDSAGRGRWGEGGSWPKISEAITKLLPLALTAKQDGNETVADMRPVNNEREGKQTSKRKPRKGVTGRTLSSAVSFQDRVSKWSSSGTGTPSHSLMRGPITGAGCKLGRTCFVNTVFGSCKIYLILVFLDYVSGLA
jgi:hypothetical protein